MITALNNSKTHTVTVWSNNWTESATHDLILFSSLESDLIAAGIDAETVFNVDGDAYVIMVKSPEGTLEIGPGTMTVINGHEVLTSRVNGIQVYREDGSTVEFDSSSTFEAFVLTIIQACY